LRARENAAGIDPAINAFGKRRIDRGPDAGRALGRCALAPITLLLFG
jgi:hypothetical protein